MESRYEREKIKKNQRYMKIKSLIFKVINLIFKTYMYLGFAALLVIGVVSTIYKSYLNQELPFNYQRYIHSNTELVVVLTSLMTSFFISGVISLLTEQNHKNNAGKGNRGKNRKKTSKRRLRKAG